MSDPRVVEEHHRRLALHLGMGDAEMERVLVERLLEPERGRPGQRRAGVDVAVEGEQDDLERAAAGERPGGEVGGVDAGVGVPVAARLDEGLGGPAVGSGQPVHADDPGRPRALHGGHCSRARGRARSPARYSIQTVFTLTNSRMPVLGELAAVARALDRRRTAAAGRTARWRSRTPSPPRCRAASRSARARSCVNSAAPRPKGESFASADRLLLVRGADHRGDRAEQLLVERGHARGRRRRARVGG